MFGSVFNVFRDGQFVTKNGCYHGIGCNPRYTGVELSELAESAVSGWERSRGHYVAMVNESSDSVGIGMWFDEATGTFRCTMFMGDCLLESALFGNAHK